MNYMRNLINYVRNKGLARGGVTFVKIKKVPKENLLQGKQLIIEGDSIPILSAVEKMAKETGTKSFFTSYNKGNIDNNSIYINCQFLDAKELYTSFESNINLFNNLFEKLYFSSQDCYKMMSEGKGGVMLYIFPALDGSKCNSGEFINYIFKTFTEGISKECSEKIRCNSIIIDSNKLFDEEYIKDVMCTVLFLISNRSISITGHVLECVG